MLQWDAPTIKVTGPPPSQVTRSHICQDDACMTQFDITLASVNDAIEVDTWMRGMVATTTVELEIVGSLIFDCR